MNFLQILATILSLIALVCLLVAIFSSEKTPTKAFAYLGGAICWLIAGILYLVLGRLILGIIAIIWAVWDYFDFKSASDKFIAYANEVIKASKQNN